MDLVVSKGEVTLLHFRVERPEICIGGHGTNDVVVPHSDVPEVAAVLVDRGADRFVLRDLTQGVLEVNGAKPDGPEVSVGIGDWLTLGPYRLDLRASDKERKRFGRTRVIDGKSRSAATRAVLTLKGATYTLDPKLPFNIGVHDDNDLQIEDPFASSFHCRVILKEGRWHLLDLGSTNGTEVNGLKVRDAELPVPANITVGRTLMQFSMQQDEVGGEAGVPVMFHGMVAASDTMSRVFAVITRFAEAKEPVLIYGASGSGKELVARAIHDESARAAGPYLALNCGALTANLIEAELFGHQKGAFTGATNDKPGAFEATQGGTLFLDEVGELPLDLQPKLLRVLEAQAVRRIGGTKETKVDTRVIAATHRDLEDLVRQGRFRADLFHRLYVLSVKIPPLSDRPEDILPLVQHFLNSQSPVQLTLTQAAEASLLDYTWPGNVRELRNVVVRTILMRTSDVIDVGDLRYVNDAFTSRSKDARLAVRQVEELDRAQMLDAIERAAGNRAEAARLLGVSKSTFHDRLKRLGIPLKKTKEGADGKDEQE